MTESPRKGGKPVQGILKSAPQLNKSSPAGTVQPPTGPSIDHDESSIESLFEVSEVSQRENSSVSTGFASRTWTHHHKRRFARFASFIDAARERGMYLYRVALTTRTLGREWEDVYLELREAKKEVLRELDRSLRATRQKDVHEPREYVAASVLEPHDSGHPHYEIIIAADGPVEPERVESVRDKQAEKADNAEKEGQVSHPLNKWTDGSVKGYYGKSFGPSLTSHQAWFGNEASRLGAHRLEFSGPLDHEELIDEGRGGGSQSTTSRFSDSSGNPLVSEYVNSHQDEIRSPRDWRKIRDHAKTDLRRWLVEDNDRLDRFRYACDLA